MSLHSGVPGAVLLRYSPGKSEIQPVVEKLKTVDNICRMHFVLKMSKTIRTYSSQRKPDTADKKGVKAHTSQVP